ncbi:MAG: hypothetical protein Kow0092_30870 [Deferrisomatales bacterium]
MIWTRTVVPWAPTGSVDAARRSWIAPWRVWNTALDHVYYDVGALSAEERLDLAAYARPEGAVLVVLPGGRGRRIRTLLPWEFVREQERRAGEAVDAVVVAGVGSSAVGTAALARNVADALGRPVAGIVSGMGVADVWSEALGGWFVLGAANAVRDAWARLLDAVDFQDHVRDPTSHREAAERFEALEGPASGFLFGSPDSTALLYLLLRLGERIRLVVGHSKGNYSIENALEGWVSASDRADTPLPAALCIVTLGAVVRFPPEFPRVHQFLGELDAFGLLNSRPGVDRITVPGAWHTLNPALPGHLSVAQALRRAGVGAS